MVSNRKKKDSDEDDNDQEITDEIHKNLGKKREREAGTQGETSGASQAKQSKVDIRENYHFREGSLTPQSKAVFNEHSQTSNLEKFWETFKDVADVGTDLISGNYISAGVKGYNAINSGIKRFSGNKEKETEDWWEEFDNTDFDQYNSQFSGTLPSESASMGGPNQQAADSLAGMGVPAGAQQMNARAGSGPGMGNIGVGGGAAQPVYVGNIPNGTLMRREYYKSYRFVTPTCLSRLYSVSETFAGGGGLIGTIWDQIDTRVYFLKLASSMYIPMEYLFCYMDPREYYEIYTLMNYFKVLKIGAKVHTFGARAPYTTGASSIEVANANLQAVVHDMTSLAKHYPITIGAATKPDEALQIGDRALSDTYGKMTGSTFARDGQTNPVGVLDTSTFSGVSARFEPRRWTARAWICMQEPLARLFATQTNFMNGYHNSWPNYMNFIEHSINASNHLGLAFQKSYSPHQLFWERTTRKHRVVTNNNGATNGEVPGTEPLDRVHAHTDGYTQKQTDSNTTLYYGSDRPLYSGTGGALPDISTQNFGDQLGIPEFRQATINSPHGIHDYDEKPQYPFIIAIHNIRNITTDMSNDTSTGSAANEIVDINLELCIEFSMITEQYIDFPVYYNPTIRPTAKWFKKKKILRTFNGADTWHSAFQVRHKKGLIQHNFPQTIGNFNVTVQENGA